MSDYPKCPNCGSSNTDLSKNTQEKVDWANIGEFAIGFGAGLLGLGDYVQDVNLKNDIDAEFCCKKCGYVWIPGDIYGAVTEVWVDHNVENEGEVGMTIHAKFEINGMLSRQGVIQAFFYHPSGQPLIDTNDNYRTEDGSVTCGDYFQPPYENTIYNDFQLFIPYVELHLDKSCRLLCDVYISDGNNWVAKSSQISIDYKYYQPMPKIEAQIEKTWLDYDVQTEDGTVGLVIHTQFVVSGLQNVTNQCNAYFYFENGEPLKDYNNNYCCGDGTVCIPGEYTPDYQNCRFDDFQLFIPNEELHVTGSGNLIYVISIFNGDDVIAQSEQQVFPFSYENERNSSEDAHIEGVMVVGISERQKVVYDAAVDNESQAMELMEKMERFGITNIGVFDTKEEAQDYAISLLFDAGVQSEDDVGEPVAANFFGYQVFKTNYKV